MSVIEICMIIIAASEIFRCVVMIMEMKMREQHMKNIDRTSEAVEQAMNTVIDSEPESEPIMTGIKIVPTNVDSPITHTAQAFECWFIAGDICANPDSKAFKGKCITTNPKLCRWSELRVRGEEQ